jgi:cellulase/cellobiase CelA1
MCTVQYSVSGQWQGGFQGTVTIKNVGASPVTGWTVGWTFADGQQVSQLWNGSYTQAGSSVTVTNAAWNGALAANGGTATFGFLGSWNSTNSVPVSFTVNGRTC